MIALRSVTAKSALALIAALALMPQMAAADTRSARIPMAFSTEAALPTIAIIIDDMGHDWKQGQRLIDMDQPLTLAFLPFRRYTRQLATSAFEKNKEIMLHLPMENTHRLALGRSGITSDMTREEIVGILRLALADIPHVRGMNNHMGSLLTQMKEPMEWVMAELAGQPLYFIDSRTTASTVAAITAGEAGVPAMSRDVFLDHENTREYMEQQFRRLIDIARTQGSAIGIGHPHPATVNFLAEKLPTLDSEGVAVATVSAVWSMRHGNQAMFAPSDDSADQKLLAAKPDKGQADQTN